MTDIAINAIRPGAPMRWLKAGADDLKRAPMVSIGYGLIFVALGLGFSAVLWKIGMAAWIPVLLSGFALIAPLFAVGFYQISRHLDAGDEIRIKDVWVVSGETISQVAILGLFLIILLLVWARLAQFLYVYFAGQDYGSISDFTSWVMTDPSGLTMAVVGTIIGAALAVAAFSISVISFPMLVDREVDAVTALVASVKAVRNNPMAMLTWAWLIAFWIAIGTAFFLVGLAVVFPWLGHASWRAYQDVTSS